MGGKARGEGGSIQSNESFKTALRKGVTVPSPVRRKGGEDPQMLTFREALEGDRTPDRQGCR